MATVKENLIAAKALIDAPEKWGKHDYEPRPGCYCAMGAIAKVLGNSPRDLVWIGRPGEVLHALDRQIPDHRWCVPDFNDHPETTHADIMALFDRAIAAQDGA